MADDTVQVRSIEDHAVNRTLFARALSSVLFAQFASQEDVKFARDFFAKPNAVDIGMCTLSHKQQ